MAEHKAVTGTPAAGEEPGLMMQDYTPGWVFGEGQARKPEPPPRRPGVFARIRQWWGLRNLTVGTSGTMAMPVGQHEQLSEAEAFRREHGYSAGFEPERATPEVAAHNAAVEAEYQNEILKRYEEMKAGTYRPRFLNPDLTDDQRLTLLYVNDNVKRFAMEQAMLDARAQAIAHDPTLAAFQEVNWHMELTLEPGRRVDVTKGTGQPFLQPVTPEALAQANEIRTLKAKVTEREALGREMTARDLIGSRESVLAACGGNEALADQVEANAMRTFGVTSLDEPRKLR
jgi:hypothetical protein